MEVHGIADYVITGGRVVVDEGELKVVQGGGQFVPNPPHSPYVYERIKAAEEVSYFLAIFCVLCTGWSNWVEYYCITLNREVQLDFTPEM